MMSSKKESNQNQSFYMAEPKNEEYIHRIVNGILDRRLREKSYIDVLPSRMEAPVSYIIYKSGSNIICIDGHTGSKVKSGTDAATVIQYACDQVTAGGTILIKTGVYTLTSGITVSTSCWIKGEGWHNTNDYGTMLFLGNSVDETVIHAVSGTRINRFCVSDLVIDGNKANNSSGHGIHLDTDTHEAYIYNVGVFYAAEKGIFNEDALYTKITGCTVEYCGAAGIESQKGIMIDGCLMIDNYYGFTGASGASYMFLTNCIITSNDRYGILTQTDLHVTNCIIASNSQASSGTYPGIHHSGSNALTVMNSRITGSDHQYQIHVSSGVDSTIAIGNFFSAGDTGVINDVDGTAIIRNNTGYITRNHGTAIILNGANNVVVAHGLSETPTSIRVTGTHTEVDLLYVDTVGAANLTIHASDGNTSANRNVYWEAEI